MTRRKHRPSPSHPNKRTAFDIPTSLHAFSALSRSLANDVNQEALQTQGREQLRASGQALPTAVHDWVGQTALFPDEQTWRRDPHAIIPTTQPGASSHGARHSAVAGSTARQSLSDSSHPLHQTHSQQSVPPSTIPARLSAPRDVPLEHPHEPPVRPGETLCLSKHPQQIAALMAKKRADNEASSRRAYWAQAQSERRLAQSPSSQLATELNDNLLADGQALSQSSPSHESGHAAGKLSDSFAERASHKTADNETRPNEHHDYDSLFSSPSPSPTPLPATSSTRTLNLASAVPRSRTNPRPSSESSANLSLSKPVGPQLYAANNPDTSVAHPTHRPAHYPPNSSFTRDPPQRSAPQSSSSYPPTSPAPYINPYSAYPQYPTAQPLYGTYQPLSPSAYSTMTLGGNPYTNVPDQRYHDGRTNAWVDKGSSSSNQFRMG